MNLWIRSTILLIFYILFSSQGHIGIGPFHLSLVGLDAKLANHKPIKISWWSGAGHKACVIGCMADLLRQITCFDCFPAILNRNSCSISLRLKFDYMINYENRTGVFWVSNICNYFNVEHMYILDTAVDELKLALSTAITSNFGYWCPCK